MKLRLKNTVLIGFAFMSIMVLWQAYNWFVPRYLDSFFAEISGDKVFVGGIMALDNLFALFMIPIISALSDKTKTKYGKRLPFVFIGIPVAALAFLAVPLAKDVGMPLLFFVLLVVLIAMNIYRSPAVALMPDITPLPLRSRANSIINIMGGIGTGIGFLLTLGRSALKLADITSMIGVAMVMLGCLAVVLCTVNEKKFRLDAEEDVNEYVKQNGGKTEDFFGADEDDKIKEETKGKQLDGKDKRSFVFVLLSVLFYYMAANAVETFMSLYSEKVFQDETLGLILLGILAIGSFSCMFPAALLAEKIGRKNTMFIGSFLMAVSNLTIVTVNGFSWWLVIPFFACGTGMAMMIANMYPLTVAFCKKGDFGKYTGYYYTATMVAQSVSPLLVGVFLSDWVFGSMRALMPYSAVFMVLCAVSLLFVRDESLEERQTRKNQKSS